MVSAMKLAVILFLSILICCKLITSLDICFRKKGERKSRENKNKFGGLRLLASRQDALPHHTANSLAASFSLPLRPRSLSDHHQNFLETSLPFLFSFFFPSCGAATYKLTPVLLGRFTLSHSESKCQWQHRLIISKLHLISSNDGLCFLSLSWRNEGLVECLCASSCVGSDIPYFSFALLSVSIDNAVNGRSSMGVEIMITMIMMMRWKRKQRELYNGYYE